MGMSPGFLTMAHKKHRGMRAPHILFILVDDLGRGLHGGGNRPPSPPMVILHLPPHPHPQTKACQTWPRVPLSFYNGLACSRLSLRIWRIGRRGWRLAPLVCLSRGCKVVRYEAENRGVQRCAVAP